MTQRGKSVLLVAISLMIIGSILYFAFAFTHDSITEWLGLACNLVAVLLIIRFIQKMPSFFKKPNKEK